MGKQTIGMLRAGPATQMPMMASNYANEVRTHRERPASSAQSNSMTIKFSFRPKLGKLCKDFRRRDGGGLCVQLVYSIAFTRKF